jgi:hypothetical protein
MESCSSEKHRLASTTAPDSEGTLSSGEPASFRDPYARESDMILGMKSLSEVQRTINVLNSLQLNRDDSDEEVEIDADYEALMRESRDRSHQLAEKSFTKEELEGAVAKNNDILKEIEYYSKEYKADKDRIEETEKVGSASRRF